MNRKKGRTKEFECKDNTLDYLNYQACLVGVKIPSTHFYRNTEFA